MRHRLATVFLLVSLMLGNLAVLAMAVPAGPGKDPESGRAKIKIDHSISLVNRVLRGAGIDQDTVAKARGAAKGVHAIVQLHKLPAPGDLAELRKLGIVPLAYLNSVDGTGTAYLASLKPKFNDDDPAFTRLVRAVQPMVPEDKIDLGFANGYHREGAPAGTKDSRILFFTDFDAAETEALLRKHGISAERDGRSSTYAADLTDAQVKALADEDTVQFVGAASKPDLYELGTSRALVNVDELQQFDVPSATYLGLSGLGVQLSIHDSGVDDHHNDFDNRLINTLHPTTSDHGTHVASIAGGSGTMSNQNDDNNSANGGTAFQWRGMAPQARLALYGSQTLQTAATMTDAINNRGVDVSNHSYGYTNNAIYDADMTNIDTIIRGDSPGIPPRPAVMSAGNGGLNAQFGVNSGYFALTKSCKNCILVGNLQSTGALSGSSSHGPTPDGRLKPDLAAQGTGVDASNTDVIAAGADVGGPGNSYRGMSGTSMATPAVTGIIALLLQQYAAQFNVDLDASPPLPSTMKAILLQTAQDLAGTASGTNPDTGAATTYGAGPDWATGYGQADAQAASELLTGEQFKQDSVADTDVTDEHSLSVVPGQDELKVTIAWDDLPGTPNANHAAPALVNDLDLLLIGPNGQVVRPLVMPPASQFDCDANAANGTQTGCANPGADTNVTGTVATQGTDRLNNVEQVVVPNPAPGNWKARVSVLNTDASVRLPLGGTQSYSIAGVSDATADLSVTKTASPDPATAGEQLFYTVTVKNNGPGAAANVTVVDQIPDGTDYVTADLPGGCVEDPERTLTCDLGAIPNGESRSFKIKVTIDDDLVANNGGPLSITNKVTVSSNTTDPQSGNNSSTIGTIVEDLADLEVTKICKPDGPLNASELGQCTIFVDNHGPSDARAVKVTDEILSDTTFVVSNIATNLGTCSGTSPVTGGQRFTCDLGTLEAATPSTPGRAVITYEVTADEAGDINDMATAVSDTPDPDTGNNKAQESINVTAVSDLSISKTGAAQVVAGTDTSYELSIVNDGPSTAEGVVIEDVAPAGVLILSVSGSNGATCNAGSPGNALLPTTCSFGKLAPGESRTMTVNVRILPDTLGPINNDARVLSSTFDDDLSDNLDTLAIEVSASADLLLQKSDSPDPATAGEELTYMLTVTNDGPSTAARVVVTDQLPAGTSFVDGVDGNGATVCALVQSATVTCDLGSMEPGEKKIVYLTVLVDAGVPDGAVLNNQASVDSSTPDPAPGNNSDSESTDVDTSADLWLDKTGERRSGNPSPTLVYTLTVHNDAGCESDAQSTPTPTCGDGGPSDARDIVVTDKLPLDPKKVVVQFVSPQCTYTKATHTVVCTAAEVPAGATVQFVIESQVAGSVGTISNAASLTSTTADPDPGNNTDAVTVVMKGGTGKA